MGQGVYHSPNLMYHPMQTCGEFKRQLIHVLPYLSDINVLHLSTSDFCPWLHDLLQNGLEEYMSPL